jgi:hypothetical protein
MWKNTVKLDRPQMTIWRMRNACWISKVTNTHSEDVILVAFLLQQKLHERASMLRYTYIVCLVYLETVFF